MAGQPLLGRSVLLEELDESIRSGTGVVLTGPAGVGKSHLMGALVERARPTRRVERIFATPPMRSIPFGPLLALLPTANEDRTSVMADLRERLTERVGQRRPLIAVDDAPHLDDDSMACILDVAHRGDAVVVLTVRTGEDVPPPLTQLWTGGTLRLVDVPPLDDAATVTLVEDVLGGPADDRLHAEIAGVAGGNPLFVRELVLDGIDSGSITEHDGSWTLAGGLQAGSRLSEIAQSRVADLRPDERALAETVSLVEPVDVRLVLDDQRVIETLERRRLLRVESVGDRWEVRCDHPLIGEGLRAGISPLRAADRLRTVARRAVASGCPNRWDALRASRWCLAVDEPVPVELAGVAAAEALDVLDLDLADDLLDRALRDGETWELHQQRGNVHRLRGEADAAETSFSRAAALATLDEQVAETAERRAWAFAHLRADPEATVRVLQQAASIVVDETVRSNLVHSATNFSGLLGRYDEVRRANVELLAAVGEDSPLAAAARRNLAYAQATLGEIDGVLDLVEKELSGEHGPEVLDMLRGIRCSTLMHGGALAEGSERAADDVARCRERGALHGSVGVRWGLLLHLRGDPGVHDALGGVGRELERADPFGLRPRHHGVWSAALAESGRLEEANRLLDSLDEDLDDVRSTALVGRARAVVIGCSGDAALACSVAASVGRTAIEATQVADGLLVLHEATRRGRPDLFLEVIDERTATLSPLAATFVSDAMAAAAGDGKALASIAERYLEMGATFLGADAMARAAGLLGARAADHARRLDARARVLASAVAPFQVDLPEIHDRLSDREFEIARAAMDGRTSREIADAEFVSVRTVDNHLNRIYRKLDLGGRAELARVLGVSR